MPVHDAGSMPKIAPHSCGGCSTQTSPTRLPQLAPTERACGCSSGSGAVLERQELLLGQWEAQNGTLRVLGAPTPQHATGKDHLAASRNVWTRERNENNDTGAGLSACPTSCQAGQSRRRSAP